MAGCRPLSGAVIVIARHVGCLALVVFPHRSQLSCHRSSESTAPASRMRGQGHHRPDGEQVARRRLHVGLLRRDRHLGVPPRLRVAVSTRVASFQEHAVPCGSVGRLTLFPMCRLVITSRSLNSYNLLKLYSRGGRRRRRRNCSNNYSSPRCSPDRRPEHILAGRWHWEAPHVPRFPWL